MATKAERARSEEQRARRVPKAPAVKKKPKKDQWSHESAHAGAKATHAFEETAPGKRPSRESTRGSANRAKNDTAFNLTQQLKKNAPANRARKSRRVAGKVRGGGK